MIDWQLFLHILLLLKQGIWITLLLVVYASLLGGIFALIWVSMRSSSWWGCRFFSQSFGNVFRGTPIVVQLFLFYYGIGSLKVVHDLSFLWWIFSDGFHCAILVLSLNFSAYLTEILIGGFRAIPKGLFEAAHALGLPKKIIFFRLSLPLSLRYALPAFSNEWLLLVKSTSLTSTITVMEITAYSKRAMSQTFAIGETFLAAACLYLCINVILFLLVQQIEKYFRRHGQLTG